MIFSYDFFHLSFCLRSSKRSIKYVHTNQLPLNIVSAFKTHNQSTEVHQYEPPLLENGKGGSDDDIVSNRIKRFFFPGSILTFLLFLILTFTAHFIRHGKFAKYMD